MGQQASLAVSGRGSLLIQSTNDAIGRGRWSQKLTVVFREKKYLVVGITYSERDTLDPKAGGSCDLNLLSGKGTRNDKPVTGGIAPIELADWSSAKMPKACDFG